MEKIKLYIDVDDTILKSRKRVVEMANEKLGTNYDYNKIKTWNFEEIREMKTEEVSDLFKTDKFWDGVELYEDVEMSLALLEQDEDLELIFFTKGVENNLRNKEKFLKEKFPNIKFEGLLVKNGNYTGKTIENRKSILIDDNIYNFTGNSYGKINFCGMGANDHNIYNGTKDLRERVSKKSIEQDSWHIAIDWKDVFNRIYKIKKEMKRMGI